MHDELQRLIASSEAVDFGGPEDGARDEWIAKAEERLGVRLPPSYKWWLQNYGGGEVGGEEIYSIYGPDFETAVGGDIVFVALANMKNRICGPEKLYVCRTGVDESYFFDTTEPDDDGEYKVFVLDETDGSSEPYADTFAEFLRKRIAFFG